MSFLQRDVCFLKGKMLARIEQRRGFFSLLRNIHKEKSRAEVVREREREHGGG